MTDASVFGAGPGLDGLIGTADDGTNPPVTPTAPNDMIIMPGGAVPPIGNNESASDAVSPPVVSLAAPGEGSFSYAEVVGVVTGTVYVRGFVNGGFELVQGPINGGLLSATTSNATLAITPLLGPGVTNLDLIATSVGADGRYQTSDDEGECIQDAGCTACNANGLAPGQDGNTWTQLGAPVTAVDLPVAEGASNVILWNVGTFLTPASANSAHAGRSLFGTVDALAKIPDNAGPGAGEYIAFTDVPQIGYMLPLPEVASCDARQFFPSGDYPNLEDEAGNPFSGAGLCSYLKNVILPVAQVKAPGDIFIAIFKNTSAVLPGGPLGLPEDITFQQNIVATGNVFPTDVCAQQSEVRAQDHSLCRTP